jgi:Flp pilus assembly protein TadB
VINLARNAAIPVNAGMASNSFMTFFVLLANFFLVPLAVVDNHAMTPLITQVALIICALAAVLVIYRLRRRLFWLWLLIPAYSLATFLGNIFYVFYYR